MHYGLINLPMTWFLSGKFYNVVVKSTEEMDLDQLDLNPKIISVIFIKKPESCR